MKTSELTGAALDWAVAKAEGWSEEGLEDIANGDTFPAHSFSTDWSLAGPIIERESINLIYRHPNFNGLWTAFNDEWDDDMNGVNCGDTPLIAAMRCYVASKLGDEVEVPDELQDVLHDR